MASSAIPLPLQKAIDFLPIFIEMLAKARRGLIRSMRAERKAAMLKFLTVILLSTSLQHDGAICYITDKTAKPKTLEELANEAGISFDQAKRCLALLKELEYITSKQIKRKNKINGQLEVSPGLRFLTKKFWQAVGLWDLFKKSMEWAKKHCKRMLLMPFKGIVQKAKKNFVVAGEVVGSVLKVMTPEQERTKFWCNKILTNLRQNK